LIRKKGLNTGGRPGAEAGPFNPDVLSQKGLFMFTFAQKVKEHILH